MSEQWLDNSISQIGEEMDYHQSSDQLDVLLLPTQGLNHPSHLRVNIENSLLNQAMIMTVTVLRIIMFPSLQFINFESLFVIYILCH
ncbi:hypothetical protein FGO68_gene16971 [Halteria grandinella]|uniref:Uncharacterized protein n=1 Tax=Halteria grandinella TaxID=5974 RepID=A0A8J8NBN9_HALGN|nr:hypothetical protein FGO68_gene16971 [Halteria grandinella]